MCRENRHLIRILSSRIIKSSATYSLNNKRLYKLDPSVFTEGSDVIALKTVLSECFLVDFENLIGVCFSGITACAYIVECGYGQILEVFFLDVDLVELLRNVYRQ